MSERDRAVIRVQAGVRPPHGRTFDEMLSEAFEAGRQHALDRGAPDFGQWKRGLLP